MAKITGDVWDVLAYNLKQTEKNIPGFFDKATKRCGDIYVEETKKAIRRMNLYRTGALSASVKRGPVIRVPGGRIVEVWPQGIRTDAKHPKGERNETIAFVNIHGRKYRTVKQMKWGRPEEKRYAAKNGYAGRDYLTEADNTAGPKCVAEMESMLSEVLGE